MQTPTPTPSKPGARAEEPIDRRLKETRQSMAVLISALKADSRNGPEAPRRPPLTR